MVDCGAEIETGPVYDTLISKRTLQLLKDAVIGESKAADPGGNLKDIDYGSFTF